MKFSATFFILLAGTLVVLPGSVQAVETLPNSLQQVDTLRVLKAASDSELNAINSVASAQTAELKQLKRQYSKLLAEKEQLLSDYQELERELSPQQNKLAKENMALAKQMKMLIAEKLDLRTQLDNLDNELQQAQKVKEPSTSDKNNLKSNRQGFNKQFAALQQKLVEQMTMAQQVKDDLQQQLQQSQTELAAAAGQIEEKEERLQKISAEKTALAKQLELLSADKPGLLPQVKKPAGEQPEAQDIAAIEKAVKGWTQAWSEQKVEDYLSFYSADFQPPGFKSRLAWEQQRRTRLKRPKFIIVALSNIKFDVVAPTSARVTFTQSFKSNTYTDTMRKRLEMQKEAGGWKILREGKAE